MHDIFYSNFANLFVNAFFINTILPIEESNVATAFIAGNAENNLFYGIVGIVVGGMLGFYFNAIMSITCMRMVMFIFGARNHSTNTEITIQQLRNNITKKLSFRVIATLIGLMGGYFFAFGILISTFLGIFAIRSKYAWLGLWMGCIAHWYVCWHNFNNYY